MPYRALKRLRTKRVKPNHYLLRDPGLPSVGKSIEQPVRPRRRGVRDSSRETITGGWLISAAHRHATTDNNKLLGSRYTDTSDRTLKPFPSYLEVAFGIARHRPNSGLGQGLRS